MQKTNNNLIIKIFCIVLGTFVLMICASPKSNASFDFTYNDVEYSLPDLPADSGNFNSEYYSIFKLNSTQYQLLSYVGFNPSTMYVINSNETTGIMGIVDLNGNRNTMSARVKFWTSSSSGWTLDSWQPSDSTYQYYNGAEKANKFVYSTVDIHLATYSSLNGPFTVSEDFFFQEVQQEVIPPTPPTTPTTQGVEIPAIAKVEELPKAILETMKILLPIGLVIFGIVLVIYLIRSMRF